jgi:hypothetical protein
MNELFAAHFIQEPYYYVQTLENYRVREFMKIAQPFILAIAGFALGYLVRHLQSRLHKTHRYKRKVYPGKGM